MPSHYGYVRSTLTPEVDYTLAVEPDGATTADFDLWIGVIPHNRAGIGLAPTLTHVTGTAGQKLVVTINSPKSGEEPFRYIIAAATENDPTKLLQIAYVPVIVRNFAQRTELPETFPVTLELTDDHHLSLPGEVADTAALPANPVPGMMRVITLGGQTLQYDPDAVEGVIASGSGYWVQTTLPLGVYLVDTESSDGGRVGCDRSLGLLPGVEIIEPMPYSGDGGDHTAPVRVDFSNGLGPDGGPLHRQGTMLTFRFYVSGVDVTVEFNARVKIGILGYVDRATGELDTSVKRDDVWYTVFQKSNGQIVGSNIQLPADLPRGYAVAFLITLSFNGSEFNQARTRIPRGSGVTVTVEPAGLRGFFDTVHLLTGDIVYQAVDRFRIVPGLTSIRRLGGIATIQRHTTPTEAVNFLDTGPLLPDLPGQLVAIDATLAGQITIRRPGDDLLTTEGLRAIASSQPGTFSPSAPTLVTIAASEAIELKLTFPTAIRLDYPDLVAEQAGGVFNAYQVRVFVTFGGTTYEAPEPYTIALGLLEQTIRITDIGAWTAVTALPDSSADPSFCLWGYTGVVAAQAAPGGSLSTGDYAVQIAWHYPSPNNRLTAVSHDPSRGCVPEQLGSFNDVFQGQQYWGGAAQDSAALRAIGPEFRLHGKTRPLLSNGYNYKFNTFSTDLDDGLNAIKPDDIPVDQPGRWLLSGGGVGGGGVETFTGDPALYEPLREGGLVVKTDVLGLRLFVSTGRSPGDLVEFFPTQLLEAIVVDVVAKQTVIDELTGTVVWQPPAATMPYYRVHTFGG